MSIKVPELVWKSSPISDKDRQELAWRFQRVVLNPCRFEEDWHRKVEVAKSRLSAMFENPSIQYEQIVNTINDLSPALETQYAILDKVYHELISGADVETIIDNLIGDWMQRYKPESVNQMAMDNQAVTQTATIRKWLLSPFTPTA